MRILQTKLKDSLIIEPKIFSDSRGSFFESYNSEKYNKLFKNEIFFYQDNISVSKKNVLRGLHLQKKNPQGKLVSCVYGEVLDVAVDLRKNSESYLSWHAEILSQENLKQFWIPPGFAHGFYVLSDLAIFVYKCSERYFADDEICIAWNDPTLSIDWNIETEPLLSEKDKKGLFIKDADF